jgi:YggT family protein
LPLLDALFGIAQVLLDVISLIVLVQAVMSWLIVFNVINTYNDGVRSLWQGLDRLTAPLYRPIRRLMPDFGSLDLSPLVLLLILRILGQYLLPGIQQQIHVIAGF